MNDTFTATVTAKWEVEGDDQVAVDTLTVGRFTARVENWGEYARWSVAFRGAGLDEGFCGHAADARRHAEDRLREYIAN